VDFGRFAEQEWLHNQEIDKSLTVLLRYTLHLSNFGKLNQTAKSTAVHPLPNRIPQHLSVLSLLEEAYGINKTVLSPLNKSGMISSEQKVAHALQSIFLYLYEEFQQEFVQIEDSTEALLNCFVG
jgi:hypothetical protein